MSGQLEFVKRSGEGRDMSCGQLMIREKQLTWTDTEKMGFTVLVKNMCLLMLSFDVSV